MFLTHLWKRALRQRTANGPHHRRSATPRSFRPQLEELESRLVPSNTTVFTVTSTGDDPGNLAPPTSTSGPSFTLRDAILGANATGGPAKIVFDLGNPQTLPPIQLLAPLPTLVNDDTIIDGTSEPGWNGQPIVIISGTLPNGGRPVQSAGLTINANGCTIKGLAIESFGGDGVDVSGNSNVLVNDTIAHNLGRGVVLEAGASNNIIGGTTAFLDGFNNEIFDNSAVGILIQGTGTSGNIIEGNFISQNSNGGVRIEQGASNNVIGGTAAGAGNSIKANGFILQVSNVVSGIDLFGTSGNVIQGNQIVGNSGDGVSIDEGSANNTIGGLAPGAGNVIANNGTPNFQGGSFGWGVELTTLAGTGNTIEENSISNNVRGGITLGVLPAIGNANPPASPEPNNAQNAPFITSVTSNGTTTSIIFSLSSAPNSTYRIEFFAADPTGQGETFLGSMTVKTNTKGQFKGTFTFTGTASAFTATATDSAGDTSAFAKAVSVPVSNGLKKH
ncbi:MAG TPA: right-handed parallel beta-helix repeat-containing protein [Gemmataceae bacterium]|jgi:parallel beta-helix repeat protein